MFQIEATARPGHTPEEIEAAVQQELDRLRAEAPAAAEVERARNRLETEMVRNLQRFGGFGGVADQLNYYNHYLDTPDYLAQDIARHRAVTPDSVRQFVQRWLRNDARVVVYGVPGTQKLAPEAAPHSAADGAQGQAAVESINEDEPWRATQPKSGPAVPPRLPVPQTFTLANGLTVILAEQPSLPFVSARLVVGTGSDASPVDRPGLANFAVAMLNQGTATRSALQVADDAAQLGTTIDVASTMDASTVTTSALSRNFPAALNLLADVALRPGFPAAEVERQRTVRLANIVQQRGNPQVVASAVFAAALYGPAHPYAFTEIGTAEANKSITRDELQAFWRRHFVPQNAALVVAGAITQAELKQLAEKEFGAWMPAGVERAGLGAGVPTRAKLVIVDRPGSPQTQLRVGLIGAPRSTPDYIALQVMNEVLGGSFSSRINMNLREEHGYTYGAGSQFVFRRSAGPFMTAAGVRTDVTAPAVAEILKEIDRMVNTRVTADELTLAKDSLTRSLPGNFETTDRTVASLSSIFIYGLPLDYYSTLAQRIQGVEVPTVQSVAKKYLIPDKLLVVAVGDRAKIGAGLETQLGPAEIRDPDGVIVR